MSKPFKLIIVVSEYLDGSHPVGISTLSYEYETQAESAFACLKDKNFITVHKAYDPAPTKASAPINKSRLP